MNISKGQYTYSLSRSQWFIFFLLKLLLQSLLQDFILLIQCNSLLDTQIVIHTYIFSFWWERLNYRKIDLEKGVFIALKFVKLNLKGSGFYVILSITNFWYLLSPLCSIFEIFLPLCMIEECCFACKKLTWNCVLSNSAFLAFCT